MNESATYSVLLSGDLKAGFEPAGVVEAFARLFKLPPEKAGSIIGTRFVLKREVELKVAKIYQEKLTAIGIDVKLERHGGIEELELEPVEPADGEQAEPLSQGEMICPKCELRQARADKCGGCGVFAHKVLPMAAEPEATDEAVPAPQPDSIEDLALEPVVSADGDVVEPLGQDEMVCPKCELRQARAEECSGCGVFVHKVSPMAVEPEFADEVVPALQPLEPFSVADSAVVGGDVNLKQPDSLEDLALEPMESADGELFEPLTQGEMICPKCKLRQAKADQCSGCDVFMHKVMPKVAEPEAANEAVPAAPPHETISVTSNAATGLTRHDAPDELEPVESVNGKLDDPPVEEEMICSECGLRQASADECACCGVLVHKELKLELL